MKQLILTILLCLKVFWGYSAALTETDSLQQVLQTMPHDSTRLLMLKKMAQIEQTNPKCIHFANLLLQESERQKNDKFSGIAAYLHIIYYYNQNQQDSVKKWLIQMEPFARKAKIWDLYFDAQRFQIDMYSYQEQFEYAINEAHEMYRKAQKVNCIRGLIGANQCLANAYISTERWKEGVKALEEAHKLLPQIDNAVVRISVLSQLISVAKERKDKEHLLQYLKELENILSQHTTANPLLKEAFYNVFIFNEIYYSYYFLSTNQLQIAYEHLSKAKEYLNENTFFMYKVLYHDAYATYYRQIKEYDRAISSIDTTVFMLKSACSTDYIHQQAVKADILVEAGRLQEALPLYQNVLHAKDSLENQISDKQLKQIKENYNIDKIILEEEQLKNGVQLTALVIVLIILIVLSLFTIRIYRVRKELKYSEAETRKATQMAEEANDMKNRFLSNMSYNIRIPLNGVVGFSQLIASDPGMPEETRKEFSAIIQKNTEELMRLVNDVLDLSRLEANMTKWQMQEYDIIAICNDAIYMARMQNDEHINIRFNTTIDTFIVWADINRLTQTLLSTLVCPQQKQGNKEIIFSLMLDAHVTMIRFQIINSPLADLARTTQEITIRHEINRLLLEHFGGTYEVIPDSPEGPTIIFTYPANLSE